MRARSLVLLHRLRVILDARAAQLFAYSMRKYSRKTHRTMTHMTRARDLTTTHLQILEAVAYARRVDGDAPSVRELGQRCGLFAPCRAQYYVDQLVSRGLLDRKPRVARSLKVTALGEAQLRTWKRSWSRTITSAAVQLSA